MNRVLVVFRRLLPVVALAACATPPVQQTAPVGDPTAATAVAPATDPAVPADTTVAAAPEAGAVQVVEPDIVCRTVKATGSNIREQQCFKRDELERMSTESRDFLRTRGVRGSTYRPPDPEDPRSDK